MKPSGYIGQSLPSFTVGSERDASQQICLVGSTLNDPYSQPQPPSYLSQLWRSITCELSPSRRLTAIHPPYPLGVRTVAIHPATFPNEKTAEALPLEPLG